MNIIRCKRCGTRMWEDEDGGIYCTACGWEINTPTADMYYDTSGHPHMALYHLINEDPPLYDEPGQTEGD